MADVETIVVERRHREAACEVTDYDGKTTCSEAFAAGDPSLCKCKGDSYPWRNKERIAKAIAKAEARGFAAGQADILIRQTGKLSKSIQAGSQGASVVRRWCWKDCALAVLLSLGTVAWHDCAPSWLGGHREVRGADTEDN